MTADSWQGVFSYTIRESGHIQMPLHVHSQFPRVKFLRPSRCTVAIIQMSYGDLDR